MNQLISNSKILGLPNEAWFSVCTKGQIISKCLLESSISSKKRTKTHRIVVKMNSFISFVFWKNSRLDNLLSKLTDL